MVLLSFLLDLLHGPLKGRPIASLIYPLRFQEFSSLSTNTLVFLVREGSIIWLLRFHITSEHICPGFQFAWDTRLDSHTDFRIKGFEAPLSSSNYAPLSFVVSLIFPSIH